MPVSNKLLLLAMSFLLVKHCIADFFLQTAFQHKNKGRYLHPGGLLHSLIHVVMTVPVFALLPPANWQRAAAILIVEYVIHYHVDWTKDQVGKRTGWTPQQNAFWRTLGIDQLVHGLTYVGILWALVTPGLAEAL